MKSVLPGLLALNAGYVDTAGFLALHGLFTTHVTGNFVTLGAALLLDRDGVAAKLLALPVFCAVVFGTRRLVGPRLPPALGSLRAVLGVKLALLCAAAALIIHHGPFASGDGAAALAAGMLLVAAMAVQNALQRIHLTQFPPTTIMTGNVTQLMVDLADLARGAPAETRQRARRLGAGILAFAAGCALGALLYAAIGDACFLLPPALSATSLALVRRSPV